jgi:hypothetical protein|tara:strand:+ start:578 stop:880 length:303 start_codon:yes stop_codon:yes gene_type:complete
MVVECKVESERLRQWLQSEQVTHFVEEDGSLVSAHGDFVGDEFDLWPSIFTWVDDGNIHLGTEGDKVRNNAQWFVDTVGIPVVSRTLDKLYTPTKGIPLG